MKYRLSLWPLSRPDPIFPVHQSKYLTKKMLKTFLFDYLEEFFVAWNSFIVWLTWKGSVLTDKKSLHLFTIWNKGILATSPHVIPHTKLWSIAGDKKQLQLQLGFKVGEKTRWKILWIFVQDSSLSEIHSILILPLCFLSVLPQIGIIEA